MEAPLQIRLIEAWERHARIHRDEERIDVLGSIVAIVKAGNRLLCSRNVRGEVDLDLVVPQC